MPKMPCLPVEVILGVDTHRDTHAVVLVDLLGRLVASAIDDMGTFASTYVMAAARLTWLASAAIGAFAQHAARRVADDQPKRRRARGANVDRGARPDARDQRVPAWRRDAADARLQPAVRAVG